MKKEIFKKVRVSSLAILIVTLSCFAIDFSFKNWEKQDRVIEYDVHWYYFYLPAKFIYDDIKQEKSDYRFSDTYYLFWPNFTEKGEKINKTTMGLSMLYAPFFFVAHLYAKFSDYPANGFSEPYKIFLLLSTIFYLIIGLDFLRKSLSKLKFSEKNSAITILLIGLGTNLLCYSSQSAPYSHTYSFFLFSIFIYYTIKWYDSPSFKNTLVIGLLLGLISLIRPSNLLIIVFFALYGIADWDTFKARLLFFKKEILFLCAIPFLAFLIWMPQLLYWKTITGSYIYYSYTDEHFFFGNPKIIDGLFSFRKGWLVYTPIMVFSLLGLFLKNNELIIKLRLSISVFFILNIYVIFSWWCWWYGGTFGQRSLIESYALLSIPLAGFVNYIAEKKWIINVLFYAVCTFFIWLNIFQIYQFEYKSLHHDSMTMKLYFKQFGKLEKVPGFEDMLNYIDYDEAKGQNKTKIVVNNYVPESAIPADKKIIERKKINLIAYNNNYVCDDGNLNHIIVANKSVASTWELFELIAFKDSTYSFLTYNNRFISAELNSKNELTADRIHAWEWETFKLIALDSNKVALKADNGKYVGVKELTLRLVANSDSIGSRETFKIVFK